MNTFGPGRRARAFTLVELLVVIPIPEKVPLP
jgi:competence protein ComGC